MSSIPNLGSSTPLTSVCTPDRNKKELWRRESAELQYCSACLCRGSETITSPWRQSWETRIQQPEYCAMQMKLNCFWGEVMKWEDECLRYHFLFHRIIMPLSCWDQFLRYLFAVWGSRQIMTFTNAVSSCQGCPPSWLSSLLVVERWIYKHTKTYIFHRDTSLKRDRDWN